MTEFIINNEQLERLIEAIEHDTGREVNRLVIDGVRASEIVRCRDCVHCYDDDSVWQCALLDFGIDYITSDEKPCGFCAWGERRFITCKCGEEIEPGDRESAVCPSCGRTVRE